eukprot:TRINITY_DN15398_c0_g1_i1.p1 TRINITY_DN15398_c0_g1~~TRINITY_DN15398_c0_g1_i1.p1  ORF type:complete len:326 (-),score=21.98 TRINITY_DN15398_c0_g1_i1:5-898(-)
MHQQLHWHITKWFVPRGLPPDQEREAKLLVSANLFLILLGCVFATLSNGPHSFLTLYTVADLIVFSASLLALQRSLCLAKWIFYAHLNCAAWFAGIVGLMRGMQAAHWDWQESPMSAELTWLSVIPILLFYAEGVRAGIYGYFFVCIEIMLSLAGTLWFRPDLTGEKLHLTGTSMILISTMTCLSAGFQLTRQHMVEKLKQTNATMQQVLEELEGTNLQLRKATDAKSRFLANMTHELRTPMHGIIVMAEHLLTEHRPVLAANSISEPVQIISECADQLLPLLTDLLDFSRLESCRK